MLSINLIEKYAFRGPLLHGALKTWVYCRQIADANTEHLGSKPQRSGQVTAYPEATPVFVVLPLSALASVSASGGEAGSAACRRWVTRARGYFVAEVKSESA
jgi:hypothetical protein